MGNAHWSSCCFSACALFRAQVSLILETPCLLHFCVGQIIGTLHISLGSFLGKLLVFRPFCFIVLESLLVSKLWLSASIKFSWVGHHAEFHGSSASKESTCNAEDPVPFLVQEDPLEEGMAPQYSCLENPHGQRRLMDYSPWGPKELDMTKPLSTR